ncbi:hypothetical protein JKP88DRAFT_163619, partial [Tribonema minus]
MWTYDSLGGFSFYASGFPAGTTCYLFARARNTYTGANVVLNTNGRAVTFPSASPYYESALFVPYDLTGSDRFGCSVAVSGRYAVIGVCARSIKYTITSAGVAQVQEFSGATNQWVKTATLYPDDVYTGDSFGYAVSVSGTYAVITANQADPGCKTNAGAAYVFERNDLTSVWEQKTKLVASDALAGDGFGSSVAVSGTYAMVGASPRTELGTANSGGVYVFERNASSAVWEQKAILFPSDLPAGSYFGNSVSISGTYAIAGAYQKSGGGGAYIFERNSGTGVWEQKGILTCSDSSTANFGFSVAIDGTYAIIGANAKTVSSLANSGGAYVFERLSGTWTQTAAILTASDSSSGGFGYSVSIDGAYAIIGAYSKTVNSVSSAGGAYVFERVTGTWTQAAILDNPDPVASDHDQFGRSVSVSGTYAAIGAYASDPIGKADAGAAYIFERNASTGAWEQNTKLIASDAIPGDFFGSSIGVSGTYAIVGAPSKRLLGTSNSGGAYMFERDSGNAPAGGSVGTPSSVTSTSATVADVLTGAYTVMSALGTQITLSASTMYFEAAALTAFDPAVSDMFGNAVGMSASYFVVGAFQRDPLGVANAGSAYVMELNNSTGEWEHKAVLYPSDAAATDMFGSAVSVRGTYAVIGSYLADPAGEVNAGAAYVFERDSSSGTWVSGGKLVASDGMPGDNFGISVAVSSTYAIVGAYSRTRLGVSASGGAYVFERNSDSGVWEQRSVLFPSDLPAGSRFGASVSISGTYAIVGAYTKSGGGGAYIFERNPSSGIWEEKAILTCSDSTVARFGFGVSVDGTYAIVSAYYKTVNSLSQAGGAYVFERIAGAWTQTAILDNPDPAASDQFGFSVSASGIYAVIGCNLKDPSSKNSAGSMYLYKRNATTGGWENKVQWAASDGLAGDQLGFSVGVYGTTAVAGA